MKKCTLLAAVAFACFAGGTSLAQASGILRLDDLPVGEIDPAKGTDAADSVLQYNLYDALVMPQAGSSEMSPHLAERWSVEDGGKSYVFNLRRGVKFHSGNELTAHDVKFSMERLIALGKGYSHLFRGRIASIDVVDDYTVRFNLSQIHAPFVASLTRLFIVDRDMALANKVPGEHGEMGDYGSEYLSRTDAGSGAYRVEAHNPQELTVLGQFDDYFVGGAAEGPDTVRFRYGLAGPTVRTLMAKGEHDLSSQWLPPETLKAMAEEDGMKLVGTSGGSQLYIHLNTQKAPLDDVHCRRALSYAFDYATMLKMVQITSGFSAGAPSSGPIAAGLLGANPDSGDLQQDMEKAHSELAQCAHDSTKFELEISWFSEVPLESRVALLMQSNFASLGFKSKIVSIPWARFGDLASKPETTPHISQVYRSATTPDPDSFLYSMYHSTAGGTWQSTSWLNDPEVDELLQKGREVLDGQARQKIYSDLAARLISLAPSIYAYSSRFVHAAAPQLSAPLLEDEAKQLPIPQANFQFRLMRVQP